MTHLTSSVGGSPVDGAASAVGRPGSAPGRLPATNPFSRPWDLPLGLPDFAAVAHEDIEPAIRAGMAAQRAEWEAVATNPEPATLANTVEALERSGDLFDRSVTVLYSLTSATHCPDLDALEEALGPDLAAHHDAYQLDPRLYDRFRALDALGEGGRDADGRVLDAEAARLVHLAVEDFERAGVGLRGEPAQRLRQVNARLSTLEARFSTLVTDAMHAAGVANFTRTPALATTADPVERRRLLARAMGRGVGGEHDTRAVVLEEVALRAERAALLGHPHHASLVAAESAARTTQAVTALLERLVPSAMANARQDADVLAGRMVADPAAAAALASGESFGPADWSYYEEAERHRRFGVDDAVLAPYLELWNVVEKGVFHAAHALYGLTFHEREDLAAHMYAPGIRVWEVRDGVAAEPGSPEEEAPLLGLFVGDYYAREGKNGGAWMNSLVDQSHLTGRRPVVINCVNVDQPGPGPDGVTPPVLLTWDQVITCFHEFGHALHGLLADTRYPSASGTAVPRDVVEFPSQVNEQWALHPRVLASYARHVGTGEPLPEGLATQLRSQGAFGQGYATTEYLGAALLDQAWHTLAPQEVPGEPEAVEAFEREALVRAGIDDALVPPRYRTTYFSHAFGGGYDAAYYAYIWSEVMDADTVDWFRTDGEGGHDGDLGLNREAGETFRRELLARGNSRDPSVGYQAFRGREPEVGSLLRRRGLDRGDVGW